MKNNQKYRSAAVALNRNYQRELSKSLVNALGVDGATCYAINSQWLGVLDQIPRRR
jgi:hypothetical protein